MVPSSTGKACVNQLAPIFKMAQVLGSATSPASSPCNALSVSSCCTRRTRLAPIDSRVLNSFCRAVARANCRLATFAQAITNTIPTATMISKIVNFSAGAILPGNGEPGVMSAVAGLLHSELESCNARKREASRFVSACACCMLTPGASLPNSLRYKFSRS